MRKDILQNDSKMIQTFGIGRFPLATFAFSVCLIAGGCGNDYPETVPVTGRVMLEGGGWGKPGKLYFAPSSPAKGYTAHPATATFDAEGNITSTTTWKPGDGLVPGTYKARIECWRTPPSMEGPPAVSLVPVRYRAVATSDLEVAVAPGSKNHDIQFDLHR